MSRFRLTPAVALGRNRHEITRIELRRFHHSASRHRPWQCVESRSRHLSFGRHGLRGLAPRRRHRTQDGPEDRGEVLKERPGELVIDVGVDVVRIPTSEIKQRTGASTRTEEADASNEHSYRTAKLPVRTIKELADGYGEGVVLVQTPGGLGSGFLINEAGYCVTNFHVVEKETRIAATIFHRGKSGEFERRRIQDVKIVALNPFFDLALLQIPAQADLKFRPVYLAKESDLREGDEVFAIGNPLGLERSVSQGIVSTRNRNFNGMVFIQTTCQINPGNSGGPLFNLKGKSSASPT